MFEGGGGRVLEGLSRAVMGLLCLAANGKQAALCFSEPEALGPAGLPQPPSDPPSNPPLQPASQTPPTPNPLCGQADLYEAMGVETDESAGTDFRRLEAALMPKKRRF